jgi:ferric-dicitrate binding protein FerR (iron transport regulator)
METARAAYLFERYFNKTATQAERAELLAWISREEKSEEVKALMDKAWEDFHGSGIVFTETQSEEMLRSILHRDEPSGLSDAAPYPETPPRRMRWLWVAATLACLVVAGYLWLGPAGSQSPGTRTAAGESRDIAPGGNKATLTLANGTSITLDSAGDGMLAQQGGTHIVKLASGQLAYKAPGSATAAAEPPVNTLVTPRGGQYRVELPDGSRVWLNAASSLKFPAAFAGDKREVELTGEAYFEIARDDSKPFRVTVRTSATAGPMIVEVLGTHFDIKAYRDEPTIKATLVEGSVRVRRANKSRLLRPAEQADIRQGSDDIRVSKANIEDVVAWKNGFFHFNGDDMSSIMRKLERWYDVTVTYQGAVPSGHYTGIISRHTNLSEVLKMLELSGVHFRIQGRKIIVIS